MTTSDGTLSDPRAETAIEWMVEIASGEMTDGQIRAFEDWLNADPRNEAVWVRLQEGLMPCGIAARQELARGSITRRVRDVQISRRRFLRGTIGIVALGSLGVAAARTVLPEGALLADHFTLSGQQDQVALADGSEIILAPRAAVDVGSGAEIRRVRVLDGDVMVKVAAGRDPFDITADAVSMLADQGVFLVNRRSTGLSMTGVEGSGFVGGDYALAIRPGDRIDFFEGRFERRTVDVEVATAWTKGLLIANNQTLASVVEELRPYFRGIIRVDPAIAHVRVTAVLKLREPDAALDALAGSLDLKVSRFSGLYATIGPSLS